MERREATPRNGLRKGTRGAPRPDRRRFRLTWLALPGSALASLLVGAGMLAALGASPVTGYRALFDGAFGDSYALSATAVKAVPLLLVGVGICIAFRANVFNIGGEGQIAMGAIAATTTALAFPDFPAVALIPLTLVAGALGGAFWGAIPGAFKGYLGVNEILTTIMLNLVAVQLMNYFLSGPLRDRTQPDVGGLIPQTRLLPESSWLPILKDGTQLHLGVAIAVAAAVCVYVLLWRTSFGFRIRAVGLSRDAATYAGMPVARTTTLALTLSGALCGMAGAMLVFGSISHRMVTDGSLTGFTGSAGFNGIVVALFGGLNPLWTIVSAFVFAGLLVGGDAMQVVTNVPSDLIVALNGLVVVFVVSTEFLRRRPRPMRVEPPEPGDPTAADPDPAGRRMVEAPT